MKRQTSHCDSHLMTALPDCQDEEIARYFYPIITGPYKLTPTSFEDARFLASIPTHAGTGMTLSFWYRHVACVDDGSMCSGGFLFRKWDPLSSTMTGFNGTYGDTIFDCMITSTSIYLSAPAAYLYYDFADYGIDGKFHMHGAKVWRHIALQLHELADEIWIYLDGALAMAIPSTTRISSSDWNPRTPMVAVGHYGNNIMSSKDASIAYLRMYVHGESGPLSESQVYALAQAPTPHIRSEHKCLPVSSHALADAIWTDTHGHSCKWFHEAKKLKAAVCELPDVAENCGTSCQSKQQCLFTPDFTAVYFAGDRIRRLTPPADPANASLCLGRSMSKAQVVAACERWLSGGELGSLGGRGVGEEHRGTQLKQVVFKMYLWTALNISMFCSAVS